MGSFVTGIEVVARRTTLSANSNVSISIIIAVSARKNGIFMDSTSTKQTSSNVSSLVENAKLLSSTLCIDKHVLLVRLGIGPFQWLVAFRHHGFVHIQL